METPKYYQLTPEPIEVIQGWGLDFAWAMSSNM